MTQHPPPTNQHPGHQPGYPQHHQGAPHGHYRQVGYPHRPQAPRQKPGLGRTALIVIGALFGSCVLIGVVAEAVSPSDGDGDAAASVEVESIASPVADPPSEPLTQTECMAAMANIGKLLPAIQQPEDVGAMCENRVKWKPETQAAYRCGATAETLALLQMCGEPLSTMVEEMGGKDPAQPVGDSRLSKIKAGDITACIELASIWNMTQDPDLKTGQLCAGDLGDAELAFLGCVEKAGNASAVAACGRLRPRGI